jgi:hypothetical protein
MSAFFTPSYLVPGTATGSPVSVPPPSPIPPSTQSGPSPALPAQAAGGPVPATALAFVPPAGATAYSVSVEAQYGSGAPASAELLGIREAPSGPVTPGQPVTVTPLWAPTTANAVASSAAQHTVTVAWR